MKHYLGTLESRRKQEAEREALIERSLRGTSKKLELQKKEKKAKKKASGELLAMLSISDILPFAQRVAYDYKPKSHNLDRQLHGLLNHLFVCYPVPVFLYKACIVEDVQNCRFKKHTPLFRQWFVTLAQGKSFPRAVKGILTSREAFLFLQAPADRDIYQNVWWSRMKALELPELVIQRLLDKLFVQRDIEDTDGRLMELLHFYVRFHSEMDKTTFGEVADFVDAKLRGDAEFRFKGRTASSMVKLSNEWHRMLQKMKMGQDVKWPGMNSPTWEWETATEIWECQELRTSRELMQEGQKQRHCVYSYVQRCLDGLASIFSLRVYCKDSADIDADGNVIWKKGHEFTRLTIEVGPSTREVIQIRGQLNRLPLPKEKQVLRTWCGEKGFIVRHL